MIIKTSLVRKIDADAFYRKVNSAITNYQDEGLYVEIQYAESAGWFSAFIIGRQK